MKIRLLLACLLFFGHHSGASLRQFQCDLKKSGLKASKRRVNDVWRPISAKSFCLTQESITFYNDAYAEEVDKVNFEDYLIEIRKVKALLQDGKLIFALNLYPKDQTKIKEEFGNDDPREISFNDLSNNLSSRKQGNICKSYAVDNISECDIKKVEKVFGGKVEYVETYGYSVTRRNGAKCTSLSKTGMTLSVIFVALAYFYRAQLWQLFDREHSPSS